jgi:phosphocarrier protein
MILRRSHPDDKLIVVTREITVQNELGLHARPAAEFVRVANSFRAEITLIKDEQRFSASSLIDVLRANLDRGASAMLEARGADSSQRGLASLSRRERRLLEQAREKMLSGNAPCLHVWLVLPAADTAALQKN